VLALAGGGAVVQLLDIAGLGFGWTDHAYGSIFFLLAGFVVMVTVAALIVVALTLYWAVRGQYTTRRHANVANVARFWAAMVVMWVVGFGTLYLGPHLT
jgi:cytochrome c oxidase subunit I+III